MKRDIKIGVVGGDTRQLAAAAKLTEEGFSVCCYATPKNEGRYKGFYRASNLEDCVRGSAAVLLGVPYSSDGRWVRCPPEDYAISLKALLCAMTPGQLLLGGRLDEALYAEAMDTPIAGVRVMVAEAEGTKCDRCWKHDSFVGTDAEHPTLCARCASVVRKMGLQIEC